MAKSSFNQEERINLYDTCNTSQYETLVFKYAGDIHFLKSVNPARERMNELLFECDLLICVNY